MSASQGTKRPSDAAKAATNKRVSLMGENPTLQALLTSPDALVNARDGFKGKLGAKRQAAQSASMTADAVKIANTLHDITKNSEALPSPVKASIAVLAGSLMVTEKLQSQAVANVHKRGELSAYAPLPEVGAKK